MEPALTPPRHPTGLTGPCRGTDETLAIRVSAAVTTDAQIWEPDDPVARGALDGLEGLEGLEGLDGDVGTECDAETGDREERLAFDTPAVFRADPTTPQALVSSNIPAIAVPRMPADKRPCTVVGEHLRQAIRRAYAAHNA